MNSMKVFSRFWQLLAVTGLLVVSQTSQATQQTDDLQEINTDNISQLVSQVGRDYYQQLDSLVKYYQLYQQKRDPRGFNVWHLRGFSPSFNERQSYYQDLLSTASADAQLTADNTVAIYSAVGTIARQLMIAFRDSDPEAYQLAVALIDENNALMATQLKQFQREAEVRTILLN